MAIINLDKALAEMENSTEFSITFVKLNLDDNTGGDRISVSNAKLCRHPGKGNHKNFGFRNNVRNITYPGAAHPVAVHPILITHLNGKTVSL
jgi:hypothetical protein